MTINNGIKFTDDEVRAMGKDLSMSVIKSVVAGKPLEGPLAQDGIVALAIITDHLNGKLDINTWAAGMGVELVVRVIKAADPLGWARTTAHADQVLAEHNGDAEAAAAAVRAELG